MDTVIKSIVFLWLVDEIISFYNDVGMELSRAFFVGFVGFDVCCANRRKRERTVFGNIFIQFKFDFNRKFLLGGCANDVKSIEVWQWNDSLKV